MVVSSTLADLHIYLDSLDEQPLAGRSRSQPRGQGTSAPQRQRGRSGHTHRLQILQASHFLNAEGVYDHKVVYWEDMNFHLHQPMGPQRAAQLMIDKLAYRCLEMADPRTLDMAGWEQLVQNVLADIRGRQLVA